MTYTEEELLPISALQHYVFCERRAALIFTEELWKDNQFTVEGTLLHTRADAPKASETRHGVRTERSLVLVSWTFGLTGKADVVEFHPTESGERYEIAVIEYKRGSPKKKLDLPFQVQLCAQALCIEDMIGYPVAQAFIYYGKTRQRIPVALDDKLRAVTRATIEQLHKLIAAQTTPKPNYQPRKCSRCSLFELCVPQAVRPRATASRYVERLLDEDAAGS